MHTIKSFINSPRYVCLLIIILVIAASLQSFLGGVTYFSDIELPYTKYNNYLIFKHSFFHLLEDKNLYILHPDAHHDLFKYSPTFALLFGVLAWMPDIAGLILWNAINAFILIAAVYALPSINQKIAGAICLFLLVELLTSIQNEQSNGLMAGLIIFTFVFLEKGKYILAAFCLVFSVYIKLFGLVALALYLLYPNKIKNASSLLFWVIVFTLLPLLVNTPSQLITQYGNWWEMLQNDHAGSIGISVAGLLETWFGMTGNYKTIVTVVGILLFCLPLLRFDQYKNESFRRLILSSILIWVVIFNHKAESPTFIIAVAGVAIWYFTQQRSTANLILLLLTLFFTSLSPTDLFPYFIRKEYFEPYAIKALPCLLVWLIINWKSFTIKKEHPLPA